MLLEDYRRIENQKMREMTGEQTTTDPLVHLFYLLARDKMPIGTITKLIDSVKHNECEIVMCNGYLAKWAKYEAARIRSLNV